MVFFKRGRSGVSATLQQVREELDEHFKAINENTCEMQANYAYVHKLEGQLNHLMARLDRIEVLLEGQPKNYHIQPLTYTEKQVFLVLYTEDGPLTYRGIAQLAGFSEALVNHYIAELIGKGVPIIKSYFDGTPFLKLNPEFKEKQAKENLINLSLKSYVED